MSTTRVAHLVLAIFVAASVLLTATMVVGVWYRYHPSEGDSALAALFIGASFVLPAAMALLGLAALLSGVVGVGLLLADLVRGRKPCRWRLAVASLACFIVFFVGAGAAGRVRMDGIAKLVTRSAPLVQALHAYERANGHPPTALTDLVPQYVATVPGTGLPAYPRYRLLVGKEAAAYEGNPWVLLVPTPAGFLNFDELAYWPKQNYPEGIAHGGWWERVGDWGYLHE